LRNVNAVGIIGSESAVFQRGGEEVDDCQSKALFGCCRSLNGLLDMVA
jgi:hypothetical protein